MRGFQFSIAFSLVRKVIARLPQAVAVITAVSLIQTSVAGQAFAAFSAPERTDYTAAAAMAQPPVPFSAGRVTGARYFGSEKTVVVIQDLHCHGEVQRNIARILERLDGSYGLSHVFVEGASGPVDTSWTALAGDGSARRETVETLLAAGRLTGAEYYAINAGRPVLISGLEDEPLYRENLARLGEIIRRRQDVSAVMKNINASLAALKGRYFSPENLKLERLMAGRRAGTVDSERYYRTLARYAEKKGIDLYDYPAVTGYCTVAQMRKRLHARAAMRELEKYTAFLKETLPYAEYAALSAERGRDTEGFYLQLASVARERGIKLRDRYPELDKFFSFLALSRALNPLELAGQERRLSRTLRTACAKSGAEKEAAFIAGYASYVDDFLNARISEEDYRYFTLNYPAFTSLWHKYVSSREIPSFGARYALSNDFYRANLERNRRFIGNMLGDTRDGAGRMFAMSPEEHSKNVLASLKKARVSVMVAGGFHTGGITELLGRKKISYAVVTPNVSGDVSFACSTYEALAREQAAAINGQTISLRLYSQRLLETPAEKRAELLKKDTVEAALTLAFQKNKDLSPERIAAAINANLGEYDGTIIYKKDFNGPGGRYVYTYRGESGSARLYITHDPASGTATTTEEVEPAAQEARKQPFMTARFLESCFRADMKRTVLLLAPVIENGSVLLIPTFIHAAVFMLSGNLSASLALFAVSALAGCWFMSYVFHQTVFEQGKEQPRDSTGVERSMIFRLFTAEVAVGFVCSLVTLYLDMPAWVTAAAVPSITFLASAVLHAGYNQQALEAGVGELFLTGGGGASPASGSIVDDQVEYLALSERALRKIYRSFIPLLAAAGFSFGPITGLNVRLAAAEQPVIVTASEIRQLGWPAILKAAKLHAKAVSYPREDGGAALYPRLIKADGNDLFGSLEEMYQMEEELNIGYGARLENGEPVAGSPFTMKETGTTVDYAVFNDFGDSPVLYRGNIPDDISRKAGLICMLNAARVNRPSRQGTGVRRLTGNEDSALLITPRGMITKNQLELLLEWEGINKWKIKLNTFPIWPYGDDNAQKMPGYEQPYHILLTRGDRHVPQAEMSRKENLHDSIHFLAKMNASPSMEGRRKFRMGISGWYYRDGDDAPKSGASQNHAHAQLMRFEFPIEHARLSAIGQANGVSVSVLDDSEPGSGIVLEVPGCGEEDIEKIAATAHAVIEKITDKGNTFNVFAAPTEKGMRVFIGDKRAGTPAPYFTNEWGFSEFARVVVVDAPVLYYDFSDKQKETYSRIVNEAEELEQRKAEKEKSKADALARGEDADADIDEDIKQLNEAIGRKKSELINWVKEQKAAEKLSRILPSLSEKARKAMEMTTEEKGTVYGIAASVVDEASERFFRSQELDLLAGLLSTDEREKISAQDPADVLIVCGNDDIDTIAEAFELFAGGRVKHLLISGGVGRLTVDLLTAVRKMDIRVDIPGFDLAGFDEKEAARLRKLSNIEIKKHFSPNPHINEADIIKKVILAMAKKKIISCAGKTDSRSADQRGRCEDMVSRTEDFITCDTKSSNTYLNFVNSLKLMPAVIKKLKMEQDRPLRAAYMQKPLQMLRTTASFYRVFADETASGRCEGIPCTVDYRKKSPGSYALTGGLDVERIIAGELWRMAIYTAAKDAVPHYRGEKGINAIPGEYWDHLASVIQAYSGREELRVMLKEMAVDFRDNDGNQIFKERESFLSSLPGANPGIVSLAEWVYGEPVTSSLADARSAARVLKGCAFFQFSSDPAIREDDAAAWAAAGLDACVIAPVDPERAARPELIELNGEHGSGSPGFSRVEVPCGAETLLCGVRAEKMSGGNALVLRYMPEERGRPLAVSEQEALAARAPLAIVKWLSDNPDLRAMLGMSEDGFKIGLIEADDPRQLPSAAADRFNGDPLFNDPVFVYASGSRGDIAAAEKTFRGFDLIWNGEVIGLKLKMAAAALRRKGLVSYTRGMPVFSETIDLSSFAGGLPRLAQTDHFKRYGGDLADTFVLKNIEPLLEKDRKGTVELVKSAARKAHQKDSPVRLIISLSPDASFDPGTSLKLIEELVRAGADGIRFDSFEALDPGGREMAGAWLDDVRGSMNSINPDALIAGRWTGHPDYAPIEQAYERCGIQRYVPFSRGAKPSIIPARAWVEMTLDGGEYLQSDVNGIVADLEYLRACPSAGIVGIDQRIYMQAKEEFETSFNSFDEYLARLIKERLKALVKDPAIMFEQARRKALSLKGNGNEELNAAARGSLEGLLSHYRATASAAARSPRSRAESLRLLKDSSRRNEGDAAEFIGQQEAVFNETPGFDEQYGAFSAAAGFASGILEREAARLGERGHPFTDPRHKGVYGWAVVEAGILVRGTVPASSLNDSNEKAYLKFYNALYRSADISRAVKDEELSRALTVARRIEAGARRAAAFGKFQPEIREAVNIFYAVAKRNDPRTSPIALAELLKLLDLYAERDDLAGAAGLIMENAGRAAPAFIKEILNAA